MICTSIFNIPLTVNYKKNSLSFIREYNDICCNLNFDKIFVSNNIILIIKKYKEETLAIDDRIDHEIIKACLSNNTGPSMRYQLNLMHIISTYN